MQAQDIAREKNKSIISRPSFWFVIFCLIHLTAWTVIPTFYKNLSNDVIEGLAWGNLWLWGYVKHPPLAPWLTAAVTDLGGTIGWPIFLLAQIGVVTAFWAIWTLAKKFLTPWHALLAVLLCEGIIYYAPESINFNPNVLMLPLWSLAILCFYQAVTTQKIVQWLLLGLLLGLAMLAKYQSIILAFTMFLFLLSTPQGRECFKQLGVYGAVLVSVLVFMPNFIFLLQHHFDAITYVAGELGEGSSHSFMMSLFSHPLKFFIEQLGAIAGIFVLLLPFYDRAEKKMVLNDFDQRFLFILGFFPFLLTLFGSFILNAPLVGRWGFPFFSLIGIILVSWLQPLITVRRLYALASLLLLFIFVPMIAAYIYFDKANLYFIQKDKAEFFPGRNIAHFVEEQWHHYYGSPLAYAMGDYYTVINIAVYASDKPIPYLNADLHESPWVDEGRLREKGGVLVAVLDDLGSEALEQLALKQTLLMWQQCYPVLKHPTIKAFPYLTKNSAKPLRILVAFVPPHALKSSVCWPSHIVSLDD